MLLAACLAWICLQNVPIDTLNTRNNIDRGGGSIKTVSVLLKGYWYNNCVQFMNCAACVDTFCPRLWVTHRYVHTHKRSHSLEDNNVQTIENTSCLFRFLSLECESYYWFYLLSFFELSDETGNGVDPVPYWRKFIFFRCWMWKNEKKKILFFNNTKLELL